MNLKEHLCIIFTSFIVKEEVSVLVIVGDRKYNKFVQVCLNELKSRLHSV